MHKRVYTQNIYYRYVVSVADMFSSIHEIAGTQALSVQIDIQHLQLEYQQEMREYFSVLVAATCTQLNRFVKTRVGYFVKKPELQSVCCTAFKDGFDSYEVLCFKNFLLTQCFS